jgi:uncharacterized membrane protein YozB (DUF420 family)
MSFTARDGIAAASVVVPALGVIAAVRGAPKMGAFGFHPILTTLGFTTMSSAAYFVKRDRSRKWNASVYAHFVANVVGLGTTLYGASIAYAMKVKYNKPHGGSLHGKIGFAVLSGLCIQSALSIGTVLLNKTNLIADKPQRASKFRLHKRVGKVLLVAFATALATGWAQTEGVAGKTMQGKVVGALAGAVTVAGTVFL